MLGRKVGNKQILFLIICKELFIYLKKENTLPSSVNLPNFGCIGAAL
jgi:hypothetical protein